ncbi:TauD/TfdA family dioxygenase [Chitiniphilus purpureus]|uniref:TauD/TfdA family dioxygenase n=1 Tax=Chitiniphilus purpureus TaxID=2981137 RepID=A0ABY6DS03_9NEIS|nr:TauD/TfdA family dioxygenase [Chitiniphilus sp. CD1]UXY17142.1 TauD/TfdA family dioxygenase [Chitiniphilus sp. CD1]
MSHGMSIDTYGSGTGIIIRGDRTTPFGALKKESVFKQLAESGYILFRDFQVDIERFSQFVQALSVRVTLDPARSFGGGRDVAQKVDAGYDALGLHCENGNSPFMPHLCWFYCEKAPKLGSQTTVCDGYRVWDRLSPQSQKAFLEQDIVYNRNVEEAKWKRFVFHMLQQAKPLEDIRLDDLIALVNDPEQTRITDNGDGSIHYAFRTAAVHPTLFSERPAFANSILGPSYHYEKPVITFADESPLTAELLEEIASVSESVTDNLDWQDGDVALIDNTRVMHGRRAIVDPDRSIYNALSYVS